MKKQILLDLFVIVILVCAEVISAQTKVDILRQMNQFGFSEVVTKAAVDAQISAKNILTLRRLQTGRFSDNFYLEIIQRHADYTTAEISDLLDLKREGLSESLIISALPELAIEQAEAPIPAVGKPTPAPAVQAKTLAELALFPDNNLNFTYMYIADLGLPEDVADFDFELTAQAAFFFSFKGQRSERWGQELNFNFLGMSLESGEDTFMDMLFLNEASIYKWYLVNGIKKDIAGEIVERGLSAVLGLSFGVTYFTTSIESQDFLVDTRFLGFTYGFHADTEIPLSRNRLYFTGFADYILQSGTVSTELEFSSFGLTFSTQSDTSVSDQLFNWGVDLVFHPSRNIPNLKINLGAVLRQLDDENSATTYSLGLNYAWGPFYKATSIYGRRE